MGKRRDLSKEDIASMISLYKAQTPTKEIAKIVGVSERSVQLWTKRFRDAVERDTPHHKGRPGKALGHRIALSSSSSVKSLKIQ